MTQHLSRGGSRTALTRTIYTRTTPNFLNLAYSNPHLHFDIRHSSLSFPAVGWGLPHHYFCHFDRSPRSCFRKKAWGRSRGICHRIEPISNLSTLLTYRLLTYRLLTSPFSFIIRNSLFDIRYSSLPAPWDSEALSHWGHPDRSNATSPVSSRPKSRTN